MCLGMIYEYINTVDARMYKQFKQAKDVSNTNKPSKSYIYINPPAIGQHTSIH